jgi:hypothetical protein
VAAFDTVTDAVDVLVGFIRGAGGESRDWYVSISHHALGRLNQGHGMQNNPVRTWVPLSDEAGARQVEKYLLAAGLQGDTGGGTPARPPTQVYVYRLPTVFSARPR